MPDGLYGWLLPAGLYGYSCRLGFMDISCRLGLWIFLPSVLSGCIEAIRPPRPPWRWGTGEPVSVCIYCRGVVVVKWPHGWCCLSAVSLISCTQRSLSSSYRPCGAVCRAWRMLPGDSVACGLQGLCADTRGGADGSPDGRSC